MVDPEGNLTPVQYEILQVIWDGDDAGSTVAEIWREISKSRSVGRTTILNLVDRLEKRGWLSLPDAGRLSLSNSTGPGKNDPCTGL